MARLMTHFWYAADAEAAVRFYVDLLPDSSLQSITPIRADNPSGAAGSVKVFEFTLMGQPYQAIEAGLLDDFNNAVSMMVEVDEQAELDRIWDGIKSNGGKEIQCGWIHDRWGLHWQIVPRQLGELMTDPDPQVAKRVAEQMLKMVKLDIAPLEAAAKGEAA
jgi:predicted 3-demethylubiquinone-9 3-methyltransferase (glyoxalase superfamily)